MAKPKSKTQTYAHRPIASKVRSAVISQWNALEKSRFKVRRKKHEEHEDPQTCAGCGLAWCGTRQCTLCNRQRDAFAAAALTGLVSKISTKDMIALGSSYEEIQQATVLAALDLADVAMVERRKRI